MVPMQRHPISRATPPAYPAWGALSSTITVMRRAVAVAGGSALIGLSGCGGTESLEATTPESELSAETTSPSDDSEYVEEWFALPIHVRFVGRGTVTIDERSQAQLRELIEILERRTDIVSIRFEGHSQESPPIDDQLLSEARAEAVLEFLEQEMEMPEGRSIELEPVGFGDRAPMTGDSSNSCGNPSVQNRVTMSVLVRRPFEESR